MNRKIRVILNRIAEENTISIENLKNQKAMGILTDEQFWSELEKMGYILSLKAWANGFILPKLAHLPYLNPGILMDVLNKLEISNQDFVSFVDWYFTEFISFFKNQENKNTFIRESECFVENINNALKQYCIKNKDYSLSFYVPTSENDIYNAEYLEDRFSIFEDMALGMLENKEKGISYSEQYEYLEFFGLNKESQEKLRLGNIGNLGREEPKKKEKKKEKKKKQSYDVVSKEPKGTLEKTIEEKAENERKRMLLVELEKYFDKNTSRNQFILEEKEIEDVARVLNALYNEEEAARIKTIILNNNKMMKQARYEEAKSVLMNEEDLLYYQYILAILYGEDKRFVAYIPMIENKIKEINVLLNEYIALNLVDQESLKEAYQEQIQLSLEILKEYGLSLPEDFEIKR